MEQKNNVVGWFEIPVTDMERAIRFYEQVFEFSVDPSAARPPGDGLVSLGRGWAWRIGITGF